MGLSEVRERDALTMQCPVCKSGNPSGFRFCGNCGSPIVSPSRGAAGPAPATDEDYRTERRRLTVMFCDLIGSTVLSTRLDPEDTQQILRQYHDPCGALIDQHEGYLPPHL